MLLWFVQWVAMLSVVVIWQVCVACCFINALDCCFLWHSQQNWLYDSAIVAARA